MGVEKFKKSQFATWAPSLLAILSFSLFFVVVHRPMFTSGFTAVPGSISDPSTTIMTIFEHWYRIYLGHQPWHQMTYFYPTPHSLGYSDSFFLFGTLHAVLRFCGLDMFSAFQCFFLISTMIGFSASLYLLHKQLNLPFLLSLPASLGITFAGPLFSNIRYTQLHSLHFFILLSVLLVGLIQTLVKRSNRSLWLSFIFGLYLGVLFFNAFVVTWLFVFYLCIFLAILSLICRQYFPAMIQDRALVRLFLKCSLLAILGFAIPMTFFVGLYLPVLQSHGQFDFRRVQGYLPALTDLVNFGDKNLIWKNFAAVLVSQEELAKLHTRDFGMTPVFLLFFVLSLLTIVFRSSKDMPPLALALIKAVLGGVLVYWILMLKWGDFSLWYYVRHLVPGASAVRVPYRSNLFLIFPILVACIYFWWQRIQSLANPWRFRAAAFLGLTVCMITAEQMQLPYKTYDADQRRREIATMHPPQNCRQFFFVNPPQRPRYAVSHYCRLAQVYAVAVGIPTVNGYSSKFPHSSITCRLTESRYLRQVKRWMVDKDLLGDTCAFDLSKREFVAMTTQWLQ